mgnify:CR=1 FL=1|tara:strand:- start:1954 stop:2139 length:186 start_codon:yes stop_codon:yes gene_type:complete
MTPKEKANKLCMTFLMETDIPSKAIAKQSALICVDEIVKNTLQVSQVLDYWQEVKQEIEKL